VKKQNWLAFVIVILMIWTILPGNFLSHSQDMMISGDIAGSSSIFAFPKSRKSAKKYSTSNKSSSNVRRSKVQTVAIRTKIRKQYDNLAKVTTRRDKIEVIRPEDLIPRQDPVKASLALTGAAQYYFNENQIDKAIEYYREASKLNAKNEFARLGLSDALTRKGDDVFNAEDSQAKIAETFYNEAITLNSDNSAAYAGIAEVYDDLGDSKNAIKNYEKALKIDPDLSDIIAPLGILYYQTGDIVNADIFLRKALVTESDDSQTYYFLGLVKFIQSSNKEAEAAFRKSIALEPKFAEAHYSLGSTLSRMNLEKEGIAELATATTLNPKYLEAWFDLGAAYFNTGEYQKSVDAYLQALKVKNDYVEAYINLADSYRMLADNSKTVRGKYDLLGQALNRYQMGLTFLQNNPKFADTYTKEELADVYSRYGYAAGDRNILASVQGIVHNWDTAISLLAKAAEINDKSIDYANLGWAYYNSARNDLKPNPDAARTKLLSAKANLEKAKSMDPNQEVLSAIRVNLGITSIDLGDFKTAIENLKAVADSRNDWAFTNYSLGVAYFKNNDLNNAVEQFKKAVSKDSNYVAAYSGLGNAYLQKNELKEVKNVIDVLKKIGNPAAINEANRLQFALNLKK
jgi:superkiller protein 3